MQLGRIRPAMTNLPTITAWIFWSLLLIVVPPLGLARTPEPGALRLSIRGVNPGSARISWPITAGGAVLESSDRLNGSVWTRVNASPVSIGEETSVTITAGDSTRFYRLAGSQLVTITETSPVSGETGVAVTRETVIHFSQPLSTNAFLGTNTLFAGFGGRRILSRAE